MRHLFQRFADFFRESDKIFLILCFATTLYGCTAVFSATYHMNTLRPFIVQFGCMILGVIAALIISSFDLEKFYKRWYVVAAVGVIPVLLTFFIGIAPEGTDDKAWLDLGITTFQPSELLKICFILTFSLHLSKIKANINKPKYLLPLCAHGATPILLIHFQGDDGTALVFAVIVVFKRLRKIKHNGKISVFSIPLLKKFVMVAVPSILQQSFISIGNIIIQGVINEFGSGVMAGYSASVKLNTLVITSFTTLANGISNYTVQNIGAKKLSRVKDGFRAGVKLVWILSVPLFAAYFFAGKWLLYLFMDEPTEIALQTGINYLRILSPFYFIISAKLVADGVLRGAEMMKQFMIATFTDLLLRVVLAIILSTTALGSNGIWCAWPIGWSVSAFLSILFYRSGIWKK